VVGSAAVPNNSGFIVWQGMVPNAVHAGQAFTIRVTAHDQIGTFITVDGTSQVTVTLENALSCRHARSGADAEGRSEPFHIRLTLTGTAFEISPVHGHVFPYAIQQVTYQIAAVRCSPRLRSWRIGRSGRLLSSLPVGDSLIHLRASDPFGAVTELQKVITVDRYVAPTPADPNAKPTYSNVPSTASITRLDSAGTAGDQCGHRQRAPALDSSDPLWMLTRQWQGWKSFRPKTRARPSGTRPRDECDAVARQVWRVDGKCSGARLRSDEIRSRRWSSVVAARRRCDAGTNAARCRRSRAAPPAHDRSRAGRKEVSREFLSTYVLQPLSPSAAAIADADTLRFVQANVGRAPDASIARRRIQDDGRRSDRLSMPRWASRPRTPPRFNAWRLAWLAWYDALFAEPSQPADDAWIPISASSMRSPSARVSRYKSP